MTLAELIAYADTVKPNAFDAATKTVWVNEVEGMVQTDVMLLDSAVTYVCAATWTGTGVSFPTTATMLLPSAAAFRTGGTVIIDGLTENAVNNSTTERTIIDISANGLTLTFADGSFTAGTADTGNAEITFDGTPVTLLAAPPHDKLYRTYLCAMIDFHHGEYDRYNNSMTLFNTQYSEYMEWYTRVIHGR